MTPQDRAVKLWNACAGRSLNEMLETVAQHFVEAAKDERSACQEIAARYGGNDAEEIAELIGKRSFKD